MASHTFPAAIVIADSRLYAGQPVTEDLMMDLRDRDQDAADTGLEGRYLYNIHGSYYDGAGGTEIVPATVAFGGGGASQTLWWSKNISIPDGVSQVGIRIFAACSISNANHYFKLYQDGVYTGQFWDNLSLLAGISWQAIKTVNVTPGGQHEFDVEAKQDAGAAAGNFYLRGLRIRTL